MQKWDNFKLISEFLADYTRELAVADKIMHGWNTKFCWDYLKIINSCPAELKEKALKRD